MKKQENTMNYPSLTLVVWAKHSSLDSKGWHCICDLVTPNGSCIQTVELMDALNHSLIDVELNRFQDKAKAPGQEREYFITN